MSPKFRPIVSGKITQQFVSCSPRVITQRALDTGTGSSANFSWKGRTLFHFCSVYQWWGGGGLLLIFFNTALSGVPLILPSVSSNFPLSLTFVSILCSSYAELAPTRGHTFYSGLEFFFFVFFFTENINKMCMWQAHYNLKRSQCLSHRLNWNLIIDH